MKLLNLFGRRILLRMDRKIADNLDKVKKMSGLSDDISVIRNALAMYQFLWETKTAGERKIWIVEQRESPQFMKDRSIDTIRVYDELELK